MRLRLSITLLALTLALAVTAPGAMGQARVPQGFVGVDFSGLTFDSGMHPAAQADRMVASGVESVRMPADWATAQPYRSFADVPAADRSKFQNVGGVPTTFGQTDAIVGLAAQRRLSILPVIIDAPPWDARRGNPPGYVPIPAKTAPYASYAAALVGRYGPKGSFWLQNPGIPRIPIRMWVIWNEPAFPFNWFVQPFQRSYVALLRAAHTAIKRADPGAKVVVGGLANFAWASLAQIYSIRGARQSFEVVDVHPYTGTPAHVIVFLKKVRDVMNRAGDSRKPMIVGEVSWASGLGKTTVRIFDIATSEAGQARNIAAVVPLLASHRNELGLQGFYYFTWMGTDRRGGDLFDFSGLLSYNANTGQIRAKPAFAAFRNGALKLEHCKQKASVATRCLR